MTSPDGGGIRKIEGHAFGRFWEEWGGKGRGQKGKEGGKLERKRREAKGVMERSEEGKEECCAELSFTDKYFFLCFFRFLTYNLYLLITTH